MFERLTPATATANTAGAASPAVPGAERHDRLTVFAIVGAIIAMVTVRLFTETFPVIPRAANVIDVVLLAGLAFLAALRPAKPPLASRWIPALGFLLVLLATVATLANLSRVELGPALVFLYGLLGPVVVFWAVYRLWPTGRSLIISRVIVALGVLQLLCVGLFSLPSYFATGNPDEISGTFGENPYQLVFFLLVFISVLAGTHVFDRGRLVTRFVPLLLVATLATIVLAEYRALVLTTGLVLLMLAGLLALAPGRRARAVIQAGVSLVAFTVVLSIGADHLKLTETKQVGIPGLVSLRLALPERVLDLYAEEPETILTGTGPGTYSSRGWVTFALADHDSEANVVGGYVLALTGGRLYRTDVSDTYVRPSIGLSTAGSYAPSNPFSSYTSVAAEIGAVGLVVLLGIYLGAFGSILRRTVKVVRDGRLGDPLPGLLLAASASLFTLLQMGLLENWLEVTRLTFISWILVAIAMKEFDARYRSELRTDS